MFPKVIRAGAEPHDLGSGENRPDAFSELTIRSNAEGTTGNDDDLEDQWNLIEDPDIGDAFHELTIQSDVEYTTSSDDDLEREWDLTADDDGSELGVFVRNTPSVRSLQCSFFGALTPA